MFIYHESVTDVDNKGIGYRRNATPFAISEYLEATNMVLLENCEGGRITMWACAKSEIWFFAWWIVIASHYGVTVSKEVLVV